MTVLTRGVVEAILKRDPRALARAATIIENRGAGSEQLLRDLFPNTGRAQVIGITGPPGAGKSTLVSQLAREFRRQGRTVAIIAVDPTSPFSGGAILGDRIRMLDLHSDAGVFVRSMATRGQMGGLAAATSDLAILFDAAAFEVVLIETVGVGQDEVDVARVADVTAVVLVPGLGDDVQSIKAGIMEIADIFIINKADVSGSDRLANEIQATLALSEAVRPWTPPIVRTIATEAKGIDDVIAAIGSFYSAGITRERSVERWAFRLRDLVRERLSALIGDEDVVEAAGRVNAREVDPYSVVDGWMQQIRLEK